jgi:hypothetical protein
MITAMLPHHTDNAVPRHLFLLIILLLASLCVTIVSATSELVYKKAKVMEGVDPKPESIHIMGTTKTEEMQPDPVTGPEAFMFMNGQCITTSLDEYQYTLCPYHNVTQRRTANTRGIVIVSKSFVVGLFILHNCLPHSSVHV